MLVYVLNKYGKPLMPCSPCKARKLLRQGKAKVKRTEPFIIQLLYGSTGYKQPIILGIDAGSKHIGVSASTAKQELYAADVEIRNDIVEKLSTRRQNRRTRRNRKTRYRKPRFQNRVKSKNWSFYNRLKVIYHNVHMTYGYVTKHNRINNNFPKEHYIDAYCIAGNFNAKRLDYYYYQKCVRKTNRQIHKAKILKGGKKKLNQAPKYVKGFQLFDKVKYDGKLYYIFGRRKSGCFDIRKLDGTKINNGSVYYKKLNLIESRNNVLTERRSRFLQTA